MSEKEEYDLLLLTGTAAEKATDGLSDIDIFLVCRYEIQTRYALKPVSIFEYKGRTFEVSIISTEKLFNDQYNKENAYWWRHTHVIISNNSKAKKALAIASRLTKKELLDRLWTNFVHFEINSSDIKKQALRGESLSVGLLFNENIKIAIDSELACKGQFLRTNNPAAYCNE